MRPSQCVRSVVALLALACESSEVAGGRHTETDSGGVRIVTSTAPIWGDSARWTLSDTPSVTIGAVDGAGAEYLLSNAHSATQLSDGRIAVGDMGSSELRYYDRGGSFLMSRGRKGQGPGEWSQLYQMRRGGGDSIQVIAPVNTHSVFSPTGEFVRRFSLEPVRNRPNIWALGRLANGALLAYSLAPAGDRVVVPREVARGEEAGLGRDTTTRPDGFYREQYMHFLYTARGKVIDSIGILPGKGQFGGRGEGPFGPRGWYAVRGDSIFFGPGDVPEVRVYEAWIDTVTATGEDTVSGAGPRPRAGMTLRRVIRWAMTDSGVPTPEIIEAYKERERATLTRAFRNSPGFSVERSIEELRFPPRLPAHGRVRVDATGAVWVQDYVLPGMQDSTSRWKIFDDRGRWLGRMRLPARFQVTEIGNDYVLGMWQNADDVQFIRKYRLNREQGPRSP